MMAATAGSCANDPDVAGVLAERVSHHAPCLERTQARGAVGVWSSPSLDLRSASAVLDRPRRASVRLTHSVEVEEVAGLLAEHVDDLVGGREAISRTGRHGIRLCPDDLVPEDPTICLEPLSNTFRSEEEAFHGRSLTDVVGIGVTEIQPERARGDEYALDFAEDGVKVVRPCIDVGLHAELVIPAVVP